MIENIPQKIPRSKYSVYPGLGDSDADEDKEPVIKTNASGGGNGRDRSDTAALFQKVVDSRDKAANVRHIRWRNTPQITRNASHLFPKKNSSSVEPTTMQSLLTDQLQNLTVSMNPYKAYAKYDGNAQHSTFSRKYSVYLHMLPESERRFPLDIVIVLGARVLDLIGLTLYRCFTKYPDIKL
ncbi:Hypothetical predicted protein, partial [Olea europaea subsp. europaea]